MQSAIPSQLGLTHRTGSLQESLAGKTLLVIGATAFVAACAHISFPLPFTPVPLTLQNFAVILVGMALGPSPASPRWFSTSPKAPSGFRSSLRAAARRHRSSPRPERRFPLLLPARRSNCRLGWYAPCSPSPHASEAPSSRPPPPPCQSFSSAPAGLPITPTITLSATWSLAVAPFIPGEIVKITAAAGIFSQLQRWRKS